MDIIRFLQGNNQKTKTFIYRDVDYLNAPSGWLEARLKNRLDEGYEIRRNEKEIAWEGRLITKNK